MMRIPHNHFHFLPTSKLLQREQIHPVLHEPCGKGVTQIMEPKLSDS